MTRSLTARVRGMLMPDIPEADAETPVKTYSQVVAEASPADGLKREPEPEKAKRSRPGEVESRPAE